MHRISVYLTTAHSLMAYIINDNADQWKEYKIIWLKLHISAYAA